MAVRWPAALKRRTAWLVVGLAIALMVLPGTATAVTLSTVNGSVIDADTSAPIEGAEVHLFGLETWDMYDAYAGPDGTFTISDVTPGEYFIDAYAGGYEDYSDLITVVDGDNAVTVEMTPLDPNVSGTITDESGEPIEYAAAEALFYSPYDGEWWTYDFTWSGADGSWGMDLPTGVYRFGFSAYGYLGEYFDDASQITEARNITIWPYQSVTGVDAELAAETPNISGTVLDEETGLPLVDANVYLWMADAEDPDFPYMYVNDIYTDEDGAYTFVGLEPGTYYLSVWNEGYREEFYDDTDALNATPVVFSGAPVDGITFELAKGVLSLSGVVTSEDTLEPVPSAYVDSYVLDGTDYVMTDYWGWSDEFGVYEIYDMAPGTYRIGYNGEIPAGDMDYRWYGPSFWDGSSTVEGATDIVVDGTQAITGYDLVLPDAVAGVSGTVTSDGSPVEEMYVDAFMYDADYEEWYPVGGGGVTTADGYYEIFGVGGGQVRVGTTGGFDVEGTSYGPAFWDGATTIESADPVDVSVGTTAENIDLEVAPLLPLLQGTVVDADNEPIDGGMVFVVQEHESEGEVYWEEIAYGDVIEGAYEVTPYDAQSIDYDSPVRLVAYAGPGYFIEFYDDQRNLEDATDIDIDPAATVTLPAIVMDEYIAVATRIASDTRYSTAVEAAKTFTNDWEDVDHLILASGDDRAAADPLAASGLSWAYNGAPILLTPATNPPSSVKNAVKEIVEKNGTLTIHVVGGKVSVPDATINQILAGLGEDAENVEIDRINGSNRYDNARLIAIRMKQVRPDMPDFALVANGADSTKFFDALALSAVSAHTGAPILLVSANAVPSATQSALATLPITPGKIFVAGGKKTVSGAVFSQLGITEANRLAGATRYSTAVAVSQWAIDNGWLYGNAVGVAAKLPDALTGGALIGTRGGSLLVTDGRFLSQDTGDYLYELAPSLREVDPVEAYVFGGTKSVTKPVIDEINAIIGMAEEF